MISNVLQHIVQKLGKTCLMH